MAEPVMPTSDALAGLNSPQIPRRMVAALAAVGRLPMETVSQIAEVMRHAEGFLFSNRMAALLSPFRLDDVTADAVLTAIFSIRPGTAESIARDLHHWRNANPRNAELLPQDGIAAIQERLKVLVQDYPAVERTRKAATLAGITGRRCDSVDILCDLRPVLDAARENVDGLLPIVTLRLGYTTQDENDETLELRLDEASLAELASKTEIAQQKLNALRRYADRWLPGGWVSDKSTEE